MGNVMRFSQHVSPKRGMVESQNTLSSALLQNCEWERFFQLFGRFDFRVDWSWLWTNIVWKKVLKQGQIVTSWNDVKRDAALGQLLVVFCVTFLRINPKFGCFSQGLFDIIYPRLNESIEGCLLSRESSTNRAVQFCWPALRNHKPRWCHGKGWKNASHAKL